MPRRTVRHAAILALAATPIAGCYSASGDRLGRHDYPVVTDGMTAGDTLGAAFFQQHVHLAAAEARRERDARRGLATVSVPVD